mgnify:FL=1
MAPFNRVKRIAKSLVFDYDDTVKTAVSQMEGKIYQIHLRVPNFVNVVTATLTLEDEDGYEVYNSGAKARNDNYNLYPAAIPQLVAGNFTFKVTLSGAHGVVGPPATADATVVAVIYYEGAY